MRFLRTPESVEREVGRLIRECTRLRWAVAWASHNFGLCHLLEERESKIHQLTVGIHFYQTHPEFHRTTNTWLSRS
jgi:hypothetical protein